MANDADDCQRRSVKNRFADDTDKEMDEQLTNFHSKNKTKSTKLAVKLLRIYCFSS